MILSMLSMSPSHPISGDTGPMARHAGPPRDDDSTDPRPTRKRRGAHTAEIPVYREPVATARNLVKVYGTGGTQVRALDGVDVDIPQGRLTAIMGPSGSGKSTLMHCMAGLDSPTSGTITVADLEISSMNQSQLTKLRRQHIGFIFQAYNLVPTLTALENITLPLDIARADVDKDYLDEVVRAVGLGDRLTHRPGELSGGQQQRVAVARALVSRPTVVFADEPTGNLDTRVAADVLRLIRESVDELDQAIVMVTHEPSAAAYADRVLFLADGRIEDALDYPSTQQILDTLGRLSAARDQGTVRAAHAQDDAGAAGGGTD